MLFRMLIIDDEPIIVDGLYDLFEEQSSLELDICKAYSGRQALEWIRKGNFDIILIDINMPDINGLELIDDILKYNVHCRIIFLTGLDSFNNIYKACQYDNVQYILKMDGDEKILETVKKAAKQIEDDIKNREIFIKAQEQLSRSIPILQKEYFTGLLYGERDTSEERTRKFKELKIPLKPDEKIYILLGKLDDWKINSNISSITQILYEIINISNEYFYRNLTSFAITVEYSKILWFIQGKYNYFDEENNLNNKYNPVQIIKSSIDSMKLACENYYNICLSLILNCNAVDWDNIYMEYLRMQSILKYMISNKGEIVFIDDDSVNSMYKNLKNREKMLNNYYSIQVSKLKMLKIYLENGDEDCFFKILYEIKESIKAYSFTDYTFVWEIYYSISLIILSFINQNDLQTIPEINLTFQKIKFIDLQESLENVFRDIEIICKKIFHNIRFCKNSYAEGIVKKINKYIEDNLGGDVSLTKLSEISNYHPSHLSRVYKQITGRNLSDYINELKINKAVSLLKNREMKIYEIATALGFNTPQYFNRFFKKHKHITPQEYRLQL